jgi:hypothetical protein
MAKSVKSRSNWKSFDPLLLLHLCTKLWQTSYDRKTVQTATLNCV